MGKFLDWLMEDTPAFVLKVETKTVYNDEPNTKQINANEVPKRLPGKKHKELEAKWKLLN